MAVLTQQQILNQWIQNGTLQKVYDSYKTYAESDEMNAYRGTSLLESARKHKDTLGFTDEVIDNNPMFVQAAVTLMKLSEFAGAGAEDALESGDASKRATIEARQVRAGDTLMGMMDPKKNRDRFIQSLSSISSMEDGTSNTLGEVTSLDAGVRHKDIGLGTELWNGVMDGSAISQLFQLGMSDEDKEKEATEREMLRTGQVDTGVAGTVASLIGTVGAFVAESLLFKKASGVAFSNMATAQRSSDIMRWGLHGVALPTLQNINEQVGLTQKYLGDNEIENNFIRSLGDSAHNLAGMWAGDKILSPVITKLFGNTLMKSHDKVRKAIFKYGKDLNTIGMDDAIKGLRFDMESINGLKKATDKIIRNATTGVGNLTDDYVKRITGEAFEVLAKKELMSMKGLQAGIADIMSDYTFDLVTHNVVDGFAKATFGAPAFTVHQDQMFSLTQDGFGEGMLNAIAQRAGARTIGRLFSKAQVNTAREQMDLKDSAAIAGSAAWYKEQGLDVDNVFVKSAITLNGFYGEDFLRQMDLWYQDRVGMSVKDMATSENQDIQMMNMTNAWYANQYSGQKTLLKALNWVDGTWEAKKVETLAEEYRNSSPRVAQFFNNIVLDVMKSENLKIVDLNRDKANTLVGKIMEIFPKDKAGMQDAFEFENILTKGTTDKFDEVTTYKSKKRDDGSSIDTDVLRKAVSYLTAINAKSDQNDEFTFHVAEGLKIAIQKRVASIAGLEYKRANISTTEELLNFIKNKDKTEISLKDTDLEEAETELKELFKGDIEGSVTNLQKRNMLLNLKGTILSHEKDFGVTVEGISRFAIDRSATAKILKDLSVKIKNLGEVTIDEAATLYNNYNNLLTDNAKGLFKDYQNRINDAIANQKNLTEEGLQKKVYSNIHLAYTLARDVGYRWKKEVDDFHKLIAQPDIAKIFNDAVSNEKIFSKGEYSALKQDWKGVEDFGSRMMHELYREIHDIKESKRFIYDQSRLKVGTPELVDILTETDIDKRTAATSRIHKPMFSWRPEVESVEIKTKGLSEMGSMESIRLDNDHEINLNYGSMTLNRTNLESLELNERDVTKLLTAALIKELDMDIKGHVSRNIHGLGNVSITKDKEGSYISRIDLSKYRGTQDQLVNILNYVDSSFGKTKSMKELVEVISDKNMQFEINGTTFDMDSFETNLQFKALTGNFSLTHAVREIMTRYSDRVEIFSKIKELLETLDPTLKNNKVNQDGVSNSTEVDKIINQYISYVADKASFEYSFDMGVKFVDGEPVFNATGLRADNTTISTLTELSDGDVKLMDIQFDESIDPSSTKIKKKLQSMNIIPIGAFRNDLTPLWIQVKTLSSGDNVNEKEVAGLINIVEKVVRKRMGTGIIKTKGDDILKDGSTREPESFAEAFLLANDTHKNSTLKPYMKGVLTDLLAYEMTTLDTHTGRLVKDLGVPKKSASGVKEGAYGMIKYMTNVMNVMAKDTTAEDFSKKMDPLLKQMESIYSKIGAGVSDDDLNRFNKALLDLTVESNRLTKEFEEKIKNNSGDELISNELGRELESAYSNTKGYSALKALDDGYNDTKTALEDFKTALKRAGSDLGKLRELYYLTLTFGEAGLAAKTLSKRNSYLYAQNRYDNLGKLPNSVDTRLTKYLAKAKKNRARIYITAGLQDGTIYLDRDLTDITDVTKGDTGGKLTMNSSIGAKIMVDDNWEVRRSNQKLNIVGIEGLHDIKKEDVLLDLSSLKSIYPDFMKYLSTVKNITSTTKESLKKGNAIKLDIEIDSEEGKALLLALSHHTELKANAKKVEASTQSENLLTPWESALNRIHVKKSAEQSVDKLRKMTYQLDDMYNNQRLYEGIVRSSINRRYNTGATVVAKKMNKLRIGEQSRNDILLYEDNARLHSDKYSQGFRNVGAETHIGTRTLAQQGREFLKNNKFTDKNTKKRLQALTRVFSKINSDNFNDQITKLRDSGALSWKNTISDKDYANLKDYEQDKYFYATPVKDKNGNMIHKTRLSDDQVFSKAAWSFLYTLSGMEGKTDNKNGVIARFASDKIGAHDSGENKDLFAMNMTRFPNHNVGQNTMVFIKGITLGGNGAAIKDTWYTKIFGGDWDGDTLQILGINAHDLKGVVSGEDKVFGGNDQDVVDEIFNWHYKAYKSRTINSGATIKGDAGSYKGEGEDLGAPIAALSDARFIQGYYNVSRKEIDTIAKEEFYALFPPIKTEGEDIVKQVYSTAYVSPDRDIEHQESFTIIDPVMLATNHKSFTMEDGTVLKRDIINAYGSIGDIKSTNGFDIGKSQYKLAAGKLKDGSVTTMLLKLDSKDFGFKVVGMWNGSDKHGSHSDFDNQARVVEALLKDQKDIDTDTKVLDFMQQNLYRSIKGSNEDTIGKLMTSMVGKRIVNIGILDEQMNSVGIDNVKHGGLYYMDKNLKDAGHAVGELARKIVVSTNNKIGSFDKFNNPILGSFTSKLEGEEGNTQNTKFAEGTVDFINNITSRIDKGDNGRHMNLEDFKLIKSVKKRQTKVNEVYLKVASLVDKYETDLFGKESVTSKLDTDISEVAYIFRAIKDQIKTTVIPSLNLRVDKELSGKLRTDNFGDLFTATVTQKDDQGKWIRTINYGSELMKLLSLEKTIGKYTSGMGISGGMKVYKTLLSLPASFGKDMLDPDTLIETLRQSVNNEDPRHSALMQKNVYIERANDVKAILEGMGIRLESRKGDNSILHAANLLAKSGGHKSIMDTVQERIDMDRLQENTMYQRETQYRSALVDTKSGKELTTASFYDLISKLNMNKDDSNSTKKLLLIKHLIGNMSESGQALSKIYNMGGTMSFVDKYRAKLEDPAGVLKYSMKDVEEFHDSNRKGLTERTELLDTAISEMVRSQVETNKNVCVN